MPSIFTHAVTAAALGVVMLPRGVRTSTLLTGMACAVLPDLDVIAFAAGVEYGHPLGHRGLTHSFFFALLLAALLAWRGRGTEAGGRRFGYYALCAASHGVLDAFTNGGLGVGFFLPFDSTRYFFPVTPIEVSPIGAGFFSQRGWHTLLSELRWVWLPSAVLTALALVWRRRNAPRGS